MQDGGWMPYCKILFWLSLVSGLSDMWEILFEDAKSDINNCELNKNFKNSRWETAAMLDNIVKATNWKMTI